ncbi:tRNA (N(6)-L-threonylcarbamoyladenosine(37)-C(2))-methylthiotransferase MtaB [Methylocaldum sp.]|uniref:tRNA (N(6)-L-threonylcarbamoyladenosine(37)-C(2))- methylthiotransferase MtaB n=1 Tax=Methylocaldum sp. TaxID=1969727 RepID=UPI002D3B9ECA|nr:tRNA (N(6)-L-threonylcarbamoyladenosine(37)-C(2))-methylthiotransferase MtaB [Methylocaldum sp.]HYE37331.1 tRNA (N(6)-L-threonylcarbamoyladenosine(37)-C(2))-methylthiotransferase MtaB [Methylocaldum sp.]
MRVNLKALGCRLNEAELETWARQLQREGHRIVDDSEEADLVVLNSCAVTQDAVRKSRHLIRRTARENPRAKLVLSGCYATLNREEAEGLGVDLVVANQDKGNLIDIAKDELDLPIMPAFSTEPSESAIFRLGRQRAFIKVQDGCRYRCTFCIVTVARGEERSRNIEDIVGEINDLHGQGIQEAVLTGVHLGGYGSDLGYGLDRLIRAILERTDIPRLRLGSLEPWDLPDSFSELFENPRFMPHLHLPLQSGSDSVLRRMARRCKTADFARLVEQLRKDVPDINITTDVIVGFPGETEAEWRESLAFIEGMGFGHIHIFAYSPRSGTKAAEMPGHVPAEIKKARSRALHEVSERQKRAGLEQFLGREFPVLWETERTAPDNSFDVFGYTPNYLRVAARAEPERSLANRITAARLTVIADSGDYLLAKPISG